jgi:hypothetical protein
MKQQDQNFIPTTVSKADMDKDIGIPQAIYAHNVMPSASGYTSVGFSRQISSLGLDTFKEVFPIISSSGEKAYLAFNTDGAVYFCDSSTNYQWSLLPADNVKFTVTAGTNTGNGFITALEADAGAAQVTYTITFTSATAFSVKIGAAANTTGTVGTPCTTADGKTSFTILAGDTAFVTNDSFTLVQAPVTFSGDITTATVQGITYFCLASSGIFAFDFAAHKLYTAYAVGLSPADTKGICAAGGYLIAYSTDAVAWSSLTDPLDFTPSLVTGAGGGQVEGAKGPIRKCVGMSSGFIVFTALNAVSAIAQNNSRYPFTFSEISGCGGLTDLTLATDEADTAALYAFTTYGIQQITLTKATTALPEVTDFLTAQYFEDFDSDTNTFNSQYLTSALKKRLDYVSGRYVILSYGINSLTHAIVYDTAMQRYGKLKFPIAAAFQYSLLDADNADTARRALAILSANGAVHTVDFTRAAQALDSVLLLGKFQLARSKFLQMNHVELEDIPETASFSLYLIPSLDGKTLESPVPGYLAVNSDGLRKYSFRSTALNFIVYCKGAFNLNSLLLNFSPTGGIR